MALIPIGILSAAAGAFRVAVAGYVAGENTTVDKFAFPSDTRTTLGTGLSSSRSAHGFADSGVAGYAAGGSGTTTTDKFAFPSDSRSTLGTGLSAAIADAGSNANSGVAGYVGFGVISSGFSFTGVVNKFVFPSDTRSSLGSTITPVRRGIAGFANRAVAGYFAGGQMDPTAYSTVNKVAFPSDTVSTLSTGMSSARSWPGGFGNSGVAGYVAGGALNGSSRVTTTDKFAFPSDTQSTLGTGLSGNRGNNAGFANTGLAGYLAGGFDNSANVATVDKFTLPAETRTTLGTGLSSSRQSYGGFSNEGVF